MQTDINLKEYVRTVPDFPKKGIMFRDFSSLVLEPVALRSVVDQLQHRYSSLPIDKVVAIDSRGFIIGGALCDRLNIGMVLARKPGKLPAATARQNYQLEYGTDAIEIHLDAISPGDNVLIVDDLLATGGTCEAAAQLVEKLGGKVLACAFVIALPDLGGIDRLKTYNPQWLIEFEGD